MLGMLVIYVFLGCGVIMWLVRLSLLIRVCMMLFLVV